MGTTSNRIDNINKDNETNHLQIEYSEHFLKIVHSLCACTQTHTIGVKISISVTCMCMHTHVHTHMHTKTHCVLSLNKHLRRNSISDSSVSKILRAGMDVGKNGYFQTLQVGVEVSSIISRMIWWSPGRMCVHYRYVLQFLGNILLKCFHCMSKSHSCTSE